MTTETVIIHARFAANGQVVEISERPAALTPQEWFNFLSDAAGNAYQTFAGARGVFRLSRSDVTAFQAAAAPLAAE